MRSLMQQAAFELKYEMLCERTRHRQRAGQGRPTSSAGILFFTSTRQIFGPSVRVRETDKSAKLAGALHARRHHR
jgi:hypothetical protein